MYNRINTLCKIYKYTNIAGCKIISSVIITCPIPLGPETFTKFSQLAPTSYSNTNTKAIMTGPTTGFGC